MQYRLFKGTKVSEIGLGTWQLGSADWGVVDDKEAFSILKAFTTNGGNFIDTADVYGMGISEKVIGRFKKTVNEQIICCYKIRPQKR
ncbi:MAG: aldo/keto reductase [Segetibacter sp.]